MSAEFEEKLRGAFPANTDIAVIRTLATGVSLADDMRRNTPWLMTAIGDDHRGLFRRAAAMWQFRQDCLNGNLPFEAMEIPNSTGSSHLLNITAADFEAHIVRTDSEGAFPQDAPIRQDKSLSNEPDLFDDGKVVPLHEMTPDKLYAWLAFNADQTGGLTHACWCMPEAKRKVFLGRINILRGAGMSFVEPHVPPPPDPTTKMKFKLDVIERFMDTKTDDKKQK
ncbi:hypothetical protein [Mesorhizobium sp.]|uniref:hypothetical protein n=1 Tax=Mesorhizobium sp. TaxID=1871066 RepID=UPI000FE5F031|nr:hypothetical protein [Mesorhizobium sp.]RWO81031.1 MAG: hypothetical protein EOQ96_25685 [Mesorhizobium sp.]